MKDIDIVKTAFAALDSKKAKDIKILRVKEVTSIANYFVLAAGTSSTQVKALADEVELKLEEQSEKPQRTEGYSGANWIVLDYADVIIHIFHEETRTFYELEKLWKDGQEIAIDTL
ncbi:MAG: ribosome silencing factor [Oscillospiraceae bacterium]|jgi:ribosome-associated protein|nr:ribosome silencing factor [Oscillospiraceae bacterium]